MGRQFDYSITYEYDGEKMPVNCKGQVEATSAATASRKALSETKGKGKRAGSIVVILTPKGE